MPAAQGVRHRCRQRLFDEGVLASTQRTQRDLCVASWRRCDDDGIDLVEDSPRFGLRHTDVHPNLPRLTRTVQPLVVNARTPHIPDIWVTPREKNHV